MSLVREREMMVRWREYHFDDDCALYERCNLGIAYRKNAAYIVSHSCIYTTGHSSFAYDLVSHLDCACYL